MRGMENKRMDPPHDPDLRAVASMLRNPYGSAKGRNYAEERYRKHVWALLLSGTITPQILSGLNLSRFSRNSIEYAVLARALQWVRRRASESENERLSPKQPKADAINSVLHNPYGLANGREYAKHKYAEHLQALRLSGTITDRTLLSCDLDQFGHDSIEHTVLADEWLRARQRARETGSAGARGSSIEHQLKWLYPRACWEPGPFTEDESGTEGRRPRHKRVHGQQPRRKRRRKA